MDDEGRDRTKAREEDPTAFCPSCGHRGVAQKCKLICTNPKCSVHIILACVD